MFLLRAFVAWLALMAVEVVHSVVRTLLMAPVIGEARHGRSTAIFAGR
jgi:hypothetical protein